MVLTDDSIIADRARSLRNLYFQPERRFFHEELGYNYRLTNLQAALGLAQLERIDQIIAKKRWIGQQYLQKLADLSTIQLPVEEWWARQIYWMFGLVLTESAGFDALELAGRLKSMDIETRPFFFGMHEQPVFHKRGLFIGERYPVTERIARQGLYLPSGLGLTSEQIDQVCDAVHKAIK